MKAQAIYKNGKLESYSSCTDKVGATELANQIATQTRENAYKISIRNHNNDSWQEWVDVTELQARLAESERLRYETIQAWSDKFDKSQVKLAEKDAVIAELKSAIKSNLYDAYKSDGINRLLELAKD